MRFFFGILIRINPIYEIKKIKYIRTLFFIISPKF
jgi:hypothetical protein